MLMYGHFLNRPTVGLFELRNISQLVRGRTMCASTSVVILRQYRIILSLMCNLIGNWVENGQYPSDEKTLKKIVEGISYYNAQRYFHL